MQKLISLAALMTAATAAATTLTVGGLHAGTLRDDIADQITTCQADGDVPGKSVCNLSWSTLNGLPTHGGFAMATFQQDRLTGVSAIIAAPFADTREVMERRYGRPLRANSARVRQDDGRMANIQHSVWALDDGNLTIAAAEIRGDRPITLVNFI